MRRATNLGPLVVDPIVEFSKHGVDVASVLSGFFIPGVISRRVVARYRRRLFHDATLGDLPDPRDGPRFVITATNLSNGVAVVLQLGPGRRPPERLLRRS